VNIDNVFDLCKYLGVDPTERWFVRLNQAVFEMTDCGASISVYGTLPLADATPEVRERAIKNMAALADRDEGDRHRTALMDAYAAAPLAERVLIEQAEAEINVGNRARFVAWARTIVPDSFPDAPEPERYGVAYHNGHNEPIPAAFVLESFTIQTIIENSDAEVNSAPFEVGKTTGEQVDAWVSEMEDQADDLWCEANKPEDDDDDAPASLDPATVIVSAEEAQYAIWVDELSAIARDGESLGDALERAVAAAGILDVLTARVRSDGNALVVATATADA
jgi:hypothetical protein